MPRISFLLFCLLLSPIAGAQQQNALPSLGSGTKNDAAEEANFHPSAPPSSEVLRSNDSTPLKRPTSRLRIGLALEGGGALGLAHIGVLKWFEDHHIPIDYVAGTSMGGLVGGFYASGMTPAELTKLIDGIDWNKMLSDTTPYQQLSYRRKEDQRAYPNSLILGLKNGLSLPSGLNSGQQIGLLIDKITLPYYALNSFADLPTPFRCVATDLVSGKEVVFENGPLAEALRSTMSIPGAFKPVFQPDRVLVDGGLVNNLPTDVVKEMGADVVIAVHLETRPLEAKDIKSLFNVLDQSIHLVVAESEIRGLARADVVVSVPLAGYSSTDYREHDPIMQKGFEAAEAKAPLLDKFSLSDSEWQEYLGQRESRIRTSEPTPQFIQFEGADTPQQRENIERYLAPMAGHPLEIKKLDGILTRLTGLGRYDTAGFRYVERDGKTGLQIRVSEKNYAPPTIQPGFEVDDSESEEVGITMGARFTFLDAAGFRSEWRSDFLFGNTYGLDSELYRPFTPLSKWFFAPHGDASTRVFKIYAKGNPLADYKLGQTHIGLDFGYAFNRFSELRAGYEIGYLDANLRLGSAVFNPVSGHARDAKLHYLFDQTDSPVIPRKVVRSETTFRWFDTSPGTSTAFPSLQTKIEYFQPVSALGSVFVDGEGATTFGYTQTGIPQFFLGGPFSLSAYGLNELQGNQYYLFRGGYLHDLWILPPLIGKRVFVIGTYEVAKMYGAPNQSKFPNDVAAGVLAETAIGPLFLGGSVGDTGHHKWFFQLGRVF
ncbi:MAG TPA: patatin-like phospholipase family protein [Candidatus Acidoferrum sp.]|nr:patatin-like phospholipase family protein [Candidatus Acidoferrum sp.]